MPDPSLADATADYTRATAGIVLMTTPFWVHLLTTINLVAAAIASVCGAMIGLVGVWRILRRQRPQP